MSIIFSIQRRGELEGSPITCHFQSNQCYDLFKAGKLANDLNLVLTNEKESIAFYFDDHNSKQMWIKNELSFSEN